MEVSPRLGSVGQCPWQVLRRKIGDLHLVDTLSRDRRLGLDAGLSGGRGKVTPQGLVSSGEQIEQCAAPPVLRTPSSRSGWHIEQVQGRGRSLQLFLDGGERLRIDPAQGADGWILAILHLVGLLDAGHCNRNIVGIG